MRKRSAVEPLPKWHPAVRDPNLTPAVRRLHCRHYDGCLDIAEDWPGFTCEGCKAFAPLDALGEERDLRGCFELAAEVLLHDPCDYEDDE